MIQKARGLAEMTHADQVDKAGQPYIEHLKRVAGAVEEAGGGWHQIAAAWLHDIIEDTDFTEESLFERNVPPMVVQLVIALTHQKGEPTANYLSRVIGQEGAALIKLCDIYDNLNPVRLAYLDEITADRLRIKGASAILTLLGVPGHYSPPAPPSE